MELPDADKNGLKKYIIIAVGVILIFLSSLVLYIIYKPSPNPIPKSTVESVTFPLYFPSDLPRGYKFNPNSIKSNNHAVLYTLTNDRSSTIVISIQPTPTEFNFEEFHLKQISGSKEVLTKSGKAVIGMLTNRTVGSLVTDKSWVLTSAPANVSAKDVETVIRSLTVVEQ